MYLEGLRSWGWASKHEYCREEAQKRAVATSDIALLSRLLWKGQKYSLLSVSVRD